MLVYILGIETNILKLQTKSDFFLSIKIKILLIWSWTWIKNVNDKYQNKMMFKTILEKNECLTLNHY